LPIRATISDANWPIGAVQVLPSLSFNRPNWLEPVPLDEEYYRDRNKIERFRQAKGFFFPKAVLHAKPFIKKRVLKNLLKKRGGFQAIQRAQFYQKGF
jgi:hypothetical protein